MKQLTALAICLLAAGTIFAQNNAKSATSAKSSATGKGTKQKYQGPAVGGYILDGHHHGIPDVQAFIYAKDSSIIASGYSDIKGYYETNAVLPGIYNVKIVYPAAKELMVIGVVIKKGIAPLNITANEPTADTSLPYTYFVPVVEKKGAGGSKKK